jgi:hypothetical protein
MNENEQKQQVWRPHNGRTPFYKSGWFIALLTFFLGEIIMFVLWLMSSSAQLARYDEKFSMVISNQAETKTQVGEINRKLTDNFFGLQALQTRVSNDEGTLHELQDAVRPLPVLEATVSRLATKLENEPTRK